MAYRLRLQPTFCHRAVRGVGQRVQHGFDDDGQNDDCPAPVADDVVQLVQEPEKSGGRTSVLCRSLWPIAVCRRYWR